jgi:hypothetical protein
MVFKTSQMLLLTSPAKARGKEEVKRTALPSALYTKKRVRSHATVGLSAAIGRWTAGPPDRTATAIRRVTDQTASWPAPTATRRSKIFSLIIVEDASICKNQQFTIIIINILSFVKVQNFFV